MANFRDSAPESLSRTIHIGSDFRTVSTYRRRTSNDHPADSRPGTSIDQADTADTVDEIKVPARLKGGLKSRIINQLCETEDFSADILHIPDQPARLVLQLGVQDGQRHRDTPENKRSSRKIVVRNLPPAAVNEEYLDIFFESKKRQGGGPVQKVTLVKKKHYAIIEFEQPDAVKRVLDNVPITMHDHVVDVEAMVTLLNDDEDIDSVQIKGLRDLADELRGLEVDGVTNEEDNSSMQKFQFKEEMDRYKEEVDALKAEKRGLELTCEEHKHWIRRLKKKISENKREEQNTQQLEAKYKKLHNKFEYTNKELEETKLRLSEIDDLKRSLEETCEDQKHEVRSLQSKVSEHERDEQNTQQIEAKYKKLRNKLEDANKELEETKLRLSEIDDLKRRLEEQKHYVRSLQRNVSENERQEQSNQQLEAKYTTVCNKLEDTNKEFEETKLRLNELTGHQLSDGNPNIYRDANEPPSATKMSSRADETGEHLERFLQDLKMHLPLLEAETRHIRELKQKTDDKLLREVQEENQKLYKENEEVRKKVKALKESKQIEKKEREEAERYEKTNVPAELSEEIKRLTRKCEDTNAVNDKFKEEMDVLIAEKRNLEETCEDQKHEVRSLQRKVSENERDQQNTQQIEAKYKKLCNKLEDTNKELEETKLRLSELMGHQLSDKNPNIADLSDQSRPTKLGEMFSTLYDDQYTDAFEEICTGNDRETCEKLLDVLMDAKRFCDDKAEKQLQSLKRECLAKDTMNTSTDPSLLQYSMKELKDIRKKYAKQSFEGIYEKFVSYMTYSKYSPIFKHSSRYPKTIEFARKCVELCWIMAVHDPPLVFGSLPQRRDQFNADLFREFTKSGTTIDFPVWPVLHLYDKGPVLSKGVVEPIKESLINNRTESRSHGALGRDKYFDTENRHIHRDLGVDESSRPRPVSAIETYTTGTERDKENMFNTLRYRTGDYYDNHLAESDLSLSNLHASRTRPTSSYQQDALLSFNDRSREKYQRPSAH